MKILFRITLVIAVIILCLVGFKVVRYKYINKSGYSAVTAVAGMVTNTAPPQHQTKPFTPGDAEKPSVDAPEEFIIYTEQNSKGSPVGSTTELPDLTKSVFVGDSVSLGFSRYCAKESLMTETVFLTAGSYSVEHALSSDISAEKGYSHPIYNGKEMPLIQTLKQIQPENIYFCLGINDIAASGVEGTVKNYCKLINSVWEALPEAKIYIVSTTFMVDSAQKTNLNNLNLANLNHNMKLLCVRYDNLEYIDVMSELQDEKHALSADYCSDEFIHQSDSAYAIWAEKLGAKQGE